MLGAILLSRDALGAVVEAGLRYDDFYKPGHQHIFDVAVAVSQSGEPVDTITVAEELARLGLLEQAGGVEALHALQNATPAISNAAAYARIVQDAALLRRLILVAADISEIGYSRPDNVDDALDDAESRVFRVADRRVVDSYRDIGELMKLAVDRIEENFARGDTITGIATGYNDLDELLSGLQPSTLNIVGARPAMGKCVHADTPMVDLETGGIVTAADLFDSATSRGVLEVLSLDGGGRTCRRSVAACLDDGTKPVYVVSTRRWSHRDDHCGSPVAHGARLATAGRHRTWRVHRRRRSVKYLDGRRPFFEVEVMDATSILRFCDEIGILGKQDAVARVRAVAAKARSGYSLDTVPPEVWEDITKAKGDLSWAEIMSALWSFPVTQLASGQTGKTAPRDGRRTG